MTSSLAAGGLATGCTTRNPTGLDPDQAWQRAKEALSNGAGATTQYAYWTKKQSPKQQTGEEQQSQQTGQLEVLWAVTGLGHGTQHRPTVLFNAAHAVPSSRGRLSLL